MKKLRFWGGILSLLLLAAATLTARAQTASTAGAAAIQRLRELKSANHVELQERELRREFYDRLIFQIDSYYQGGPLRDFLAKTFRHMAERQPTSPMLDFLLQCAELMEQRQERFEDPLELTIRFLHAGGILKPLSARQFMAEQTYTNGMHSESAPGVARDAIGDVIVPGPQGDTKVSAEESFIPKLKSVEIQE